MRFIFSSLESSVDFIQVIAEHFRQLLQLRHQYVKIGLCGRGWFTFGLNVRLKGCVNCQRLYTIRQRNGSTTTLPLEVFTQTNFVADFIPFYSHKRQIYFLSHPLGGLGVTYALHLQVVGKCVVNFVFAIIEHFSPYTWEYMLCVNRIFKISSHKIN